MKLINPVFDFSKPPKFSNLCFETISSNFDVLFNDAYKAIDYVCLSSTVNEWNILVTYIENVIEPINYIWDIITHLSGVADNQKLRIVYKNNLPKITKFFTVFSQNIILYKKYEMLLDSIDNSYDFIHKKILNNIIKHFLLSGVKLDKNSKQRLVFLQEKQAYLSKKFSDNVLDATNNFSYFIENETQLIGLPYDIKCVAHEEAIKVQHNGWKFTLQPTSYLPVIKYAEYQPLREILYRAYVTRASELGCEYGKGKIEWDNTEIIFDQLKFRNEEATILGFKNFAELSLTNKMAKSTQEVITFLEKLALYARPFAEKDWFELQNFAKTELGIPIMAPWDISFVTEKLRAKYFSFSENEVKQYFPVEKVLNGLFKILNQLFNIIVEVDSADVWHSDVQFFKILTSDRNIIAKFYLDLYVREGKHNGAWMDEACGRYRCANGSIQIPIAYIICNFSPPTLGNKQALLTHEDVITLFHEFGHGLHHMLTKVDEPSISGINGVEWDAVEVPSQFMENFCWEWDIITTISSHIETEESLPRLLFEKMIAAKNFQNGLNTLKQVVLSLFDIFIHIDQKLITDVNRIKKLAYELYEKYHVIPPDNFSRWENSFSHIFAGGYAAGYYSYKWAEVLSADIYEVFEESKCLVNGVISILNPKIGIKYWQEILSVGGSRDMIESFLAFRGRLPNINALMRHNGMNIKLSS